MNRIDTILKYINDDDKILDVGCDRAKLGIKLAKKGIYSYAGDIRSNIIESAKEDAKKLNLEKYITFKVSDGVKNFDEEDINTLVISGMGSFTILNIISNAKRKYKRIITISNNKHEILRKEMNNAGYKVFCEEIIYEKGKYYNLIVFEEGKRNYSKEELYFGVNHQNKELFNELNEIKIKKAKSILKKINSEKILEEIELLKRGDK